MTLVVVAAAAIATATIPTPLREVYIFTVQQKWSLWKKMGFFLQLDQKATDQFESKVFGGGGLQHKQHTKKVDWFNWKVSISFISFRANSMNCRSYCYCYRYMFAEWMNEWSDQRLYCADSFQYMDKVKQNLFCTRFAYTFAFSLNRMHLLFLAWRDGHRRRKRLYQQWRWRTQSSYINLNSLFIYGQFLPFHISQLTLIDWLKSLSFFVSARDFFFFLQKIPIAKSVYVFEIEHYLSFFLFFLFFFFNLPNALE